MKSREIDNSTDVLDSREIIERIEELASLDTRTADEDDEMQALDKLSDEGSAYSDDWKHGATLIRDSYFHVYAEEFADDIGAIDRDAGWPLCHIDWDAAADALKADYTAVEFDGVTYWVR